MDLLTEKTLDVFVMLWSLGWLGGLTFTLLVAVNVFKWLAPGLWAKLPGKLQRVVPIIFALAGIGIGIKIGADIQMLLTFAAGSTALAFLSHPFAKRLAVMIDKKYGGTYSAKGHYVPSGISRPLSLVTHVSVDTNGKLKPPVVGSSRFAGRPDPM